MSATFISGIGIPRLIRVLARPSGMITSSSVTNPTNILCPGKHGLTTGQLVRIAGHTGSTPAIDGDRIVTVVNDYNFTVPLNVTVAGTGGSFEALTQAYENTGTSTFDATHAYETGSPTFGSFPIGARVSSYVVTGALSYPTYGRITGKAVGILTIDAWSNGTPTDGQKFSIDGYIVDLPRTQEMTESFEPDQLIHSCYGGDEGSKIKTKFKGYKYKCVLDYSKYATADMLLNLKYILKAAPNDQIILIPRKDASRFQYNVYLGESFELTKQRIDGYKKPVFVFYGKENVASYAVLDGYGYGYAQNYGVQL
jgi:hypothetical protein